MILRADPSMLIHPLSQNLSILPQLRHHGLPSPPLTISFPFDTLLHSPILLCFHSCLSPCPSLRLLFLHLSPVSPHRSFAFHTNPSSFNFHPKHITLHFSASLCTASTHYPSRFLSLPPCAKTAPPPPPP